MSDRTGPTEKRTYKKTLNLPRTSFAMKANLVQREPAFQRRWAAMSLYERVRETAGGKPRFVLHDGPPYANGDIHLGHLLNKVLKDLVVRSRGMLGYDAPFVPGWDCHGLPIEHAVMKRLGEKGVDMAPRQVRQRCHAEAEKFVKIQSRQMQRLGTLGDYAEPYRTMDPAYEAATLEVFARILGQGLVHRALRPVHWSVANRTALADAELEYRDREDLSIFVTFDVINPEALPASLGAPEGAVGLMIWTTTPWTLPANLAVAVAADAEYGLYEYERDQRTERTIVATALAEGVFGKLDTPPRRLGTCRGAELIELRYRHPFMDRDGTVVTAEYVTLEDGTGLVHTAPGHGAEDFETGVRCGLGIYCPVREDGTFDDTVPEWLRGISIWEGNDLVVEHLRDSKHLFHSEKFQHSYPHDWRSKTPVIFRATEQWFIAVDHDGASLRNMALDVTEKDVTFYPEWGRNRMRGMLESRPDWCISRQRAWGLPIPAFFGPQEGQILLTSASVRAVADQFREHGSDHWFRADAATLLEGYDVDADEQAPDWVRSLEDRSTLTKGGDIFDVWFESGSSWDAVARQRELGPVDLYLEGSDQHRGWFQLSLLTSLGATGKAPFGAILTHGFMVDIEGKKMSKSGDNALAVDHLLEQFGADICRWWVASLNVEQDIKADMELFRLAGEEYRKVRNTVRFLLSNLGDFDPATDRRELTAADASSVDAWAAARLASVVHEARAAYEAFNFRRVHDAIYGFCNDTMSAIYLAAVKDRLYCDRVDSDRRRRTQSVMHDIVGALIGMVAPILVHTADEAYLALAGENADQPATDACVHLTELPVAAESPEHAGWGNAIELRARVLKSLEQARDERGLANPLDAGVRVVSPDAADLAPFAPELADLCGVSRFRVEPGEAEQIEIEDLAAEPRCERSWKRDGTVSERSDGGWLTDRDAAAVGLA